MGEERDFVQLDIDFRLIAPSFDHQSSPPFVESAQRHRHAIKPSAEEGAPPPPRRERAKKSSQKFRARRAAVLRCRIAIPPCGSPLIKMTKSVSLPVSMLGPSSEMISDEPGKTTSEIREAASRGTTSRSSAA